MHISDYPNLYFFAIFVLELVLVILLYVFGSLLEAFNLCNCDLVMAEFILDWLKLIGIVCFAVLAQYHGEAIHSPPSINSFYPNYN